MPSRNRKKVSAASLDPERVAALRAVRKDGSDREVVLKAVRFDGYALFHASKELRGDREVVLEAVRQEGDALEWASQELRSDPEVVLEAARTNCQALAHASKELRGDPDVVLQAVRLKGLALQYSARELRSDRFIVLEAVRQQGEALCFAAKELRGDAEVVLEAVRQNGRALWNAAQELRLDPKLQPWVARANPFAARGTPAAVGNVSELTLSPQGFSFRACIGMGGQEVQDMLPHEACLADLGRLLLRRSEGGHPLLRLLLPGAQGPISPLDAYEPLSKFVQSGEDVLEAMADGISDPGHSKPH